MRPLRYLEPGSLVEITVRTVHGRLLLRPSAHLNDLVAGVLGRAQAKYRMRLHACVFLSNHFHLLVSPESPQQLAAFMDFLDGNLAKEAGRLHDWREKFWARRYHAIVVSDEEDAQVRRLSYLLAHGVKEGFVERPQDWPGVHCVHALVDGRPLTGVWVDRTGEYRALREGKEVQPSDFAHEETVGFEPVPCWAKLSEDEYRRRVNELVERIIADGRRARTRPVLGRDAVMRQAPHEKPMRSDRSPAPRCHAASKAIRIMLKQAYWEFVAAFRDAADRLKRGDRLVVFPRGAFPPPLPCLPCSAPS